MDFTEAVRNRRSIRFFKEGEAISENDIRAIVEEAGRAPSWANSQPWGVYVATGDTLARVKADHLTRARAGQEGHSDFETMHRNQWSRQAQDNMGKWGADISAYLGQAHGNDFARSQALLFQAPAIAYLTIPEPAPIWAVLDLGAFSGMLMLAASARGIDSMEAYELVKYPEPVRKALGIPSGELLATGIALGYRSDAFINSFQSKRMALDEYLTIRR